MNLNYINQVCKLLNSGGDLTRNMNTILTMIVEYCPVRNPILLIRDSIINQYFIEIAPEILEQEKNNWNQSVLDKKINTLKLQHEMILYAEDQNLLNIPQPNLEQPTVAVIYQPVIYKQQDLPLCVLCVSVLNYDAVKTVKKILEFLADMLAVTMIAKGFPSYHVRESVSETVDFPKVIGDVISQSEKMKDLASIIKKVALSKATVFIQGESGTGKEMVAQTLHENSLRRKAPFIAFNCAALPDTLLESELFGHEKGAFTGTAGMRKGRFELANNGTLFLDEIGDTSLGFQTKILRVLQTGQFERLGGDKTIQINVRFISATNVDIQQAIREGTFREDLFYRLNVINLQIPPLRERKEDIILLAKYFLDQLNNENNLQLRIRESDLNQLQSLDWPGNVRELENKVHSAFVMEKDGYLVFDETYPSISEPDSLMNNIKSLAPKRDTAVASIENEEILAIEKALFDAKGIQNKAAVSLGITLRQLRYRIKKYNIAVRKILLVP